MDIEQIAEAINERDEAIKTDLKEMEQKNEKFIQYLCKMGIEGF